MARRSSWLSLGVGLVLGGAASAQGLAVMPSPGWPIQAPAVVVKEQRGLFNLVRVKSDLRRVCGGREPEAVKVTHTAGDVAAAIFTGILYTPAHLEVSCPPAP